MFQPRSYVINSAKSLLRSNAAAATEAQLQNSRRELFRVALGQGKCKATMRCSAADTIAIATKKPIQTRIHAENRKNIGIYRSIFGYIKGRFSVKCSGECSKTRSDKPRTSCF
jgi:hypothetical protein